VLEVVTSDRAVEGRPAKRSNSLASSVEGHHIWSRELIMSFDWTVVRVLIRDRQTDNKVNENETEGLRTNDERFLSESPESVVQEVGLDNELQLSLNEIRGAIQTGNEQTKRWMSFVADSSKEDTDDRIGKDDGRTRKEDVLEMSE
jgi:hypothetical protein